MKITRRAVLHLTGLTAASLALTGCRVSGNLALGSSLPGWLHKMFGCSAASSAASSASSSEAASEAAASSAAPAPELPAYDADPLTGEAKRSNGRIV